jgi:ubiquitin C-terminal hydrolase
VNLSDVTVRIQSDAETAARVGDLCSSSSIEWEKEARSTAGLEFGFSDGEVIVMVGAISTVTTAVCSVLRTVVKERKRIVIVECDGKKYRFENLSTDDIDKTLSAAKQSVEIRIV